MTVTHHSGDPAGGSLPAPPQPQPRPLPEPQRPRRLRALRTVMALVLREMSTTYGRTPGGYLWAVLEPAGFIAIYTLILELGLRIRAPSLGVSFMLFFATGILPFLMYQRIAGRVSVAITFSRPLLAYPGVTWVDTIAARFLLQAITQLLVFYIIITVLITVFDTRAVIDMPPVIAGMGMAMLLGLGVGAMNCYLLPTFPVWQSVWAILTAPLFLISTIIFTYEELPLIGQQILWYNPLVHVVGMVRRGFYPTYDAVYVSPVYVCGLSLLLLAGGLMLTRRWYRSIINN